MLLPRYMEKLSRKMWLASKWIFRVVTMTFLANLIEMVSGCSKKVPSTKNCYECDFEDKQVPCFKDRDVFAETSCSSSDICFSLGTEDGTKVKGCGSEEHVKAMGATVGKCAGVWSTNNLILALEKVRKDADARRRKQRVPEERYNIRGYVQYTVCACKGELCNLHKGHTAGAYGSSGRRGASYLLVGVASVFVIVISKLGVVINK